MDWSASIRWLAPLAGAWLMNASAAAEPVDLRDPTPRWVEVRFEVSPPDEPGRLDHRWSPSRVAYLEPDPERRTVEIRIPTEEIEAHLATTGTETIPGSFSDFVWTIDTRTGHVLDARLSGRVRERLSIGPIRTSALVRIEVEMTTHTPGGFRAGRGILGLETHAYCAPSRSEQGCTPVRAVRFDPDSGYVNAVGSVVAATRLARIRAFSPLGEARFEERAPQRAALGPAETSGTEAVCSGRSRGSCWALLGGEP